ncbi:F-box/kelch-repeat protein At3g23880-like [Lotus japonicus]|uniref:F-box/kelch-repeat protein At3g23880-like n=1 Tax=Lotus japonicus TaxID=34305 RepID=UPI0025882EAE|nr:F-box/kelch-repeat protein At3g23880-like [Lotus japonicus]
MKPGEFDPILLWEIQVEILSWLPVKTLMQFKCVCKSWKSLISDDKSFEKLHLHRLTRNKHVLVSLIETGGPPVHYEEEQDHCHIPCPLRRLVENPSSMIDEEDEWCSLKGTYRVIGSCNGLVCFHNIWDSYCGVSDTFWVRLWNPATRLWSNKSPSIITIYHSDFASFGFGYDHSRDTYKVVGIADYLSSLETVVYCKGDSGWRTISSKPGIGISLNGHYGHFASGCLNWLAYDELNQPDQNLLDIGRRALVILSFDMCKETYRALSLPEDISDVKTSLSVLGNCLCLFQDRKGTHFDVWQMREYGVRESWTRLVSVSYEHLQCDGYMSYPRPLMCLSEDGDILMLFENQNRNVILYNLRDNSVKHIQLPDNKRWLNGYSYVQSLVSPY